MTNFVYSCKPTQHQLWCISLDPESNFSFLIIYCIDTNQFCQEIIWWSINSIKKKWFSFLVKMMASQIIKFTKVQCIEWLISPPLDHILDLNSFAWTKSSWIVKKILQVSLLWIWFAWRLGNRQMLKEQSSEEERRAENIGIVHQEGLLLPKWFLHMLQPFFLTFTIELEILSLNGSLHFASSIVFLQTFQKYRFFYHHIFPHS